MHFLGIIAQVCGFVTTIAAAIVLLIKPIRNRVLGLNEIREDGSSVGKPVVEEWKCPYHNGRMCLRLLERNPGI